MGCASSGPLVTAVDGTRGLNGETVTSKVRDVVGDLADSAPVQSIIETTVHAKDDVVHKVEEVGHTAKATVEHGIENVKEKVEGTLGTVRSGFESVLGTGTAAVTKLKDKADSADEELNKAVEELDQTLEGEFLNIKGLQKKVNDLEEDLSADLDELTADLTDTMDAKKQQQNNPVSAPVTISSPTNLVTSVTPVDQPVLTPSQDKAQRILDSATERLMSRNPVLNQDLSTELQSAIHTSSPHPANIPDVGTQAPIDPDLVRDNEAIPATPAAPTPGNPPTPPQRETTWERYVDTVSETRMSRSYSLREEPKELVLGFGLRFSRSAQGVRRIDEEAYDEDCRKHAVVSEDLCRIIAVEKD